jgi:hypothetical protein
MMINCDVTNVARPICSLCNKVKKESDLNCVEILLKRDDSTRYKNAYCRDIINCDSKKAQAS